MKNPWQRLSRKVDYQSQYITVIKDKVIQPDGSPSHYYFIEKDQFVMVVAFDHGMVYLVRQWRYPVNQESWEAPAGYIEAKEKPLPAAKRELAEETGLRAKSWTRLGFAYTSSGMTNQGFHIFLAQQLSVGKNNLEAGESDIIVKKISLASVVKMINQGKIKDGTTIVAIYFLKQYLKNL